MQRHALMTLGVLFWSFVVCLPVVLGADNDPIKIGLLYSFSGLTAISARDTVLAHEIAAEEINAKGGVLGRKLVYVVRDDRSQPAEAVKEFRRLVSRDQVDLIMGVLNNDVALAVSQVAREMQVLFVNTLAPAPALTEEYAHEYLIRINTNGTVMARTAALMAAQGPWRTYYFLGPQYGWGAGVNATFWEFLRQQKTDVDKLGEVFQTSGNRDFSAHIASILQADPDAVFCSLLGDDLIAFIQQAQNHGFFDKTQVIATSAGDLDVLRPLGAAMPDGMIATFLYAFDWHPEQEQANQAFLHRFVARAGYEPNSGNLIGYVATHLVADAMRQAKSSKPDALLRVLRGGRFSTLLGNVLIRAFDGQATFDYNVGFTQTAQNYPFKRVLEPMRIKGEDVLRSQQEIEQVRRTPAPRRQ